MIIIIINNNNDTDRHTEIRSRYTLKLLIPGNRQQNQHRNSDPHSIQHRTLIAAMNMY